MPTVTSVRDHVASLRDSFALHLEATRQPSTKRTYLDALDGLIRHLVGNGMPPRVGIIRREHRVRVVAAADFKELLKTAEGTDFTARRDTAILTPHLRPALLGILDEGRSDSIKNDLGSVRAVRVEDTITARLQPETCSRDGQPKSADPRIQLVGAGRPPGYAWTPVPRSY